MAEQEQKSNNTTLDEYPMPAKGYTMEDMKAHGFQDGDLLPLSQRRAAELVEQGMTVYAVTDESMEVVFGSKDAEHYPLDTLFAVSKEEWETSKEFRQAVEKRMECQEERESAFLHHQGDCFAIYQLRDEAETRWFRYQPLPGQGVDKKLYELAYTGELTNSCAGENISVTLETLFQRFNLNHPPDYQRPSMSVSDILAIKRDDVVSCHYCDRCGFTQLHGFLPDNPLKYVEMLLEDDYSMLDGLRNNGVKQPEEKKSVLEQLKNKQPVTEPKTKALKKSAEKER